MSIEVKHNEKEVHFAVLWNGEQVASLPEVFLKNSKQFDEVTPEHAAIHIQAAFTQAYEGQDPEAFQAEVDSSIYAGSFAGTTRAHIANSKALSTLGFFQRPEADVHQFPAQDAG